MYGAQRGRGDDHHYSGMERSQYSGLGPGDGAAAGKSGAQYSGLASTDRLQQNVM